MNTDIELLDDDIDIINVDGYYNYIKELLDISKLTTKENSILFSFQISGSECYNRVVLIEQNGTEHLLRSVKFVADDKFYNIFFENLVVDFYNGNSIVLSDFVDIDGDLKYAYRMITDNNDLFSINGISSEYAHYLADLITSKDIIKRQEEKSNISDEAGLGTTGIFGVLILFIGLVLSLFITIIKLNG